MMLISACLLGVRCNWCGDDKYKDVRAIELSRVEALIPVCPEQLGGLPTPRAPTNGQNITSQFIRGAEETLRIANQLKVKEFIGKSDSPSCGCGQIYDGTFSGKLIPGDGVTAASLKRSGIRIITEEEL